MLRFLILIALAAGCSTPRVWTTQRIGPVDIKGDVAMNVGGATGSTTASGLGLDEDDSAWSPRVDLDFAGLHINLNRFSTQHSGRGVTNSAIMINGVTIPIATVVDSSLDLEMTTAALTFDFIPTSFLDIGVGLGVGTINYDIDIQDIAVPANRAQSEEEAPMGFIAARAASELGSFLLSVDVAWIEIELDDDELSFLDTDAQLAWTFFDLTGPGFGQLVVGYRLIQADLEFVDGNSTVQANLDFDGAYVGLALGL